ncbi:MAG: type II secretion system GspH family protein [Sneathiellales bacterium]|nr:type II secretion system GspH family protein [Sneathiellales bacterium]
MITRQHAIQVVRKKEQAGFTLLELLIVVSILSAIAYVALDTLKEDTAQVRFEQTEARLNSIARAVIGKPDRQLGNGSEISGYVADTGQLPSRLRDLIEDPCQNVTAGACGWLSDGDMRFGWRGPYLATPSLGGDLSFRDGWGNIAATALEDDDNFGWDFSFCRDESGTFISCSEGVTDVNDSALKLEVISAGRDASRNGTDTGYDADAKYQFYLADYAHDALVLEMELTNNISPAGVVSDMCLRLSIPQLNDNGTASDQTDDFYELVNVDRVAADVSINPGETVTVSFDFSGDLIPWGIRRVQVFDNDGLGACDDGGLYSSAAKMFRLLPRTAPPQLSLGLE